MCNKMEATPAVVQDFKAELDTLFHSRPPVSRAKMTAVTKKAMKAMKYYKHIVMIVEKFILKASPTHKLPGLYVVDSLIRQSRHQFNGGPKDVYGSRFAKNFDKTFNHLFQCLEEDKVKIVRVLNLWKKNNIYPIDIIEPLIDLAPPSLLQLSPQEQPSSTQVALLEEENKDQATMLVQNQEQIDTLLQQQQQQLESLIEAGGGQPMISLLLNKAQQLHELQAIQQKLISDNNNNQQQECDSPTQLTQHDNSTRQQHSMSKLSEFSKALLDDFDYSSDDDDGGGGQPRPPINNDPSPMMTSDEPHPSDTLSATAFIDELNKQFIQTSKELLDQGDPPLPPSDHEQHPSSPPTNLHGDWEPAHPLDYPPPPPQPRWSDQWSPPHFPHPPNDFLPPRRYPPGGPPLGPPLIHQDHYSPNYRSRDRSPFRQGRERSPPFRGRRDRSPPPYRGRSPPYRRRTSPPYRRERRNSREWERRGRESPDRGESRRVHPLPRSDHTTVCSNTVWIGHLGKITTKEQIQEALNGFGPVKSIDHVLARGCAYVVMENRRDAVSVIDRLVIKGQKCKIAWAPGRGLKDKAYKEYWNIDKGISYIPHDVIKTTGGTMESLSDGGWVDPVTLPSDIDNTVEMTIVN